MSEPEIVLSWASGRWRARGLGLDVEHAELRALETMLECELGARGGVERVALRFDMAALPASLRQYHAHYCNYSLRIPRGARA
jgi:hypothetical protein